MTENAQNEEPKPDELNTFKEELLKRMREFETKMTSQITNPQTKITNPQYLFFREKNLTFIHENK